jgi:hypothetical protein
MNETPHEGKFSVVDTPYEWSIFVAIPEVKLRLQRGTRFYEVIRPTCELGILPAVDLWIIRILKHSMQDMLQHFGLAMLRQCSTYQNRDMIRFDVWNNFKNTSQAV